MTSIVSQVEGAGPGAWDCGAAPIPCPCPTSRSRGPRPRLRFGDRSAGAPVPSTDYIRHAAKLSRKLFLDASMGTPATPDPEFYKTLAKALEDIADGLEYVNKRRD